MKNKIEKIIKEHYKFNGYKVELIDFDAIENSYDFLIIGNKFVSSCFASLLFKLNEINCTSDFWINPNNNKTFKIRLTITLKKEFNIREFLHVPILEIFDMNVFKNDDVEENEESDLNF